MKTITVNKFNEGIKNDPRAVSSAGARVVTNFDVLSNQHKMTPYRDSEDGDSGASTSQKQNFCVALRTGTTYNLYAVGRQSAANKAEVLMKSLSTGSSTDLDDNAWATPTNNQSAVATPNFNLFVYYAKRNRIFGAEAGTTIWSFDPSSSAAWGDESHSLTYTSLAQGLVHSKDDVLYIPYSDGSGTPKIAKNDNNSWTDAALTLPADLYITSICEHGNYLAIGCAPRSGVGHSRVFLWDRDSSLATLSDSIDWGEENLYVLEEIDGILVGVSLAGGIGSAAVRFNDRVIFRYASVSNAIKFAELIGGSSTNVRLAKQKLNNRLYFMMSITLNGSVREGVWSVGRNDPYSPMSIVHERTPNNDTALTANGGLRNFIFVGDYCFISYLNASGAYALSKTNDSESYTATSIFESLINPEMLELDRLLTKKLISVGATYEPLPTGGQVVVRYKVDGGSWVTVFTESTAGATRTEPYTITASGVQFTDGVEYEFRIESTGGAVVTGLKYKYLPESTN